MKYLSYDGLKYVYGKILARINTRVEKEEGKGLSSNDYTDAEKKELAEAGKLKHSHANKGVLDSVTQKMLEKLEGIAEGANKYVHPSTSGNKHIPSGGKAVRYLVGKLTDRLNGKIRKQALIPIRKAVQLRVHIEASQLTPRGM